MPDLHCRHRRHECDGGISEWRVWFTERRSLLGCPTISTETHRWQDPPSLTWHQQYLCWILSHQYLHLKHLVIFTHTYLLLFYQVHFLQLQLLSTPAVAEVWARVNSSWQPLYAKVKGQGHAVIKCTAGVMPNMCSTSFARHVGIIKPNTK